jgi:RNA polymerase sigma-70 factor (ECF subfamily)
MDVEPQAERVIQMATPKTELRTVPDDGERALVSAAKRGDTSAFEDLVNRYERKIFRLAMNITQNREDAEDVMQEAFLKAYTHLGDFQGDSRFYTWLVRIAVNEGLMKLRKRRPGQVSIDAPVETEDDLVVRELEDWGPSPEQRFAQNEMGEILDKAINGLDEEYRVVFQLRDVEQLSTEETAEALKLSVPAVKSRLLRARLRLRAKLGRAFGKRDAN